MGETSLRRLAAVAVPQLADDRLPRRGRRRRAAARRRRARGGALVHARRGRGGRGRAQRRLPVAALLDRPPPDRRLATASRADPGRRRRSSPAAGRARRPPPRSPRPRREAVEHADHAAISKPSSRTRSIAWTVEPPVVTTSSTIRQRSPGSSGGPSTQRCSPCSLRSLRTKKAFTSAPAGERGAGDRVRAHRHPADCGRAGRSASRRTSSPSARKPCRQQDRPLGIHVVLRCAAARQRHLADHQRVLAQFRDSAPVWGQGLARGCR